MTKEIHVQTDPPKEGKGTPFFDRADEVAAAASWDFAIDMYIEGIKREPENIERGHTPMREVAMRRKQEGGKSPGFRETLKHRPTKDPIITLVNTEFLLSKDPGSRQYMLAFLKAARNKDLSLPNIVRWIGDILLQEQTLARETKKVSKPVLLQIIDAFTEVEAFDRAVIACQLACELYPKDASLDQMLGELSAKYTIKKGKFGDKDVDFIEKTRDKDSQQRQMKRSSAYQDKDFLESEVERTRLAYLSDPQNASNINSYVDSLLRTEDDGYENTAIDILAKANMDTGSFDFKMKIGNIKIRQMSRRYHSLVKRGEQAAALAEAKKQIAFELEEFAERVVNYPTDLTLKYELGRRQFAVGKLDEAIASLQQVRRDPRRRIRATTLLGRAFAKKGWLQESADQFEQALESDLTDEKSLEILYYYGDVLEKLGRNDDATNQYSKIAQIDFNYKDVRKRIDKLRNRND